MTLKIEKYADEYSTTIRLIGRVQAEHLAELEKQIKQSGSKTVLDLEELNLVDVEAVRFLGSCEVAGVRLVNCSSYIRDWIGKERELEQKVRICIHDRHLD
jgi:anti-anti-sigma regulatory factor